MKLGGVTAVECTSSITTLVASTTGGVQVPNGQVFTVDWSENVLVDSGKHTGLVVGLAFYRLADNRQGFLAESPRAYGTKVAPESLKGTVLLPSLNGVSV